jgi:hypothetical protein
MRVSAFQFDGIPPQGVADGPARLDSGDEKT